MTLQVADFDDWLPLVERRGGRSRLPPEAMLLLAERCAAGSALCLAGPDGVVVVTPKHAGGRMRLWVLLAVSTGAPGAFQRQQEAVVQVAREFGADELAFETARPGWHRLAGPGWTSVDGVFLRSV